MTKTLITSRWKTWDKGWHISLLFEPRDLWIGLYWNYQRNSAYEFYLCIIPAFPILLIIYDW